MGVSEEVRFTDSMIYDRIKIPSMKKMNEKEFDEYSYLIIQCIVDYLTYKKVNKLTIARVENIKSFCLRESLKQCINQINVFANNKDIEKDNAIKVRNNLKSFIEYFDSENLGKALVKSLKSQGKVFDWAQLTYHLFKQDYNFADSLLMEDLINMANKTREADELSK